MMWIFFVGCNCINKSNIKYCFFFFKCVWLKQIEVWPFRFSLPVLVFWTPWTSIQNKPLISFSSPSCKKGASSLPLPAPCNKTYTPSHPSLPEFICLFIYLLGSIVVQRSHVDMWHTVTEVLAPKQKLKCPEKKNS